MYLMDLCKVKENEMRVFILSMYIYVGALGCSNVQAALGVHHEAASRDSIFRSCLRVDSEEAALCAEGNVASFIRHNKKEILTLKKMGALEDDKPNDLDSLKVTEILIKIWSSETNVAAYFKKMPKTSKDDLKNFEDQVWSDSYTIHSDEVGSADKLKQMLNLLSDLIDLSQRVL